MHFLPPLPASLLPPDLPLERQCVNFRSTVGSVRSVRVVAMLIFEQNPDTPAEKPHLQSYTIDLAKTGPMVLDAILKVRPARRSAR